MKLVKSDGASDQPPGAVHPEPGRTAARVFRLLRRFWPPAALAVVGLIGWRDLRDLDLHALHATVEALSNIDLIALQAAALVAVLSMCGYDLVLNRWLGIGLPTRVVLQYSWPACTLANIVGLSGMTGSGIRFLALSRAGIAGRTIAVYAGLQLLAVPLGLGLLSAIALATREALPAGLSTSVALISLLPLGFIAYVPLFMLVTGSGTLHRRFFAHLPTLTFRVRLLLTLTSCLEWCLALAILGMALGLAGVSPAPLELVSAFAIAATAGVASQVPGGLGVLDSTLLLILGGRGFTAENVLTGILLFRLCYYLIPALIGLAVGTRWFVPEENVLVRLLRQAKANPLLGFLRLPVELVTGLGVRMLGYLTFLAGLVLLVSAGYPSLTERSALLHDYLPLILVEGSHLLSVAAGVMLLALSRGIAGQVRSAYRLALGMLLAGSLLSLLKGLDYEEALYLLALSGLLYARRTSFDRLGYAVWSRRNLVWLTMLLAALAGYAWLGADLYGEEAWATDLLRFAPQAHAPRFARGFLAMVVGAIGMLSWIAFAMPRPRLALPDPADLAQAREFYIARGGHEFAHLTLIGDKHLFYTARHDALIAFGAIRNRFIALGDPAGDPTAREHAIPEFRQFADRYGCVPVFYEVSEANLHLYHDHGFGLFKLGEQALVPLRDFSLSGKKNGNLRAAVNRAQREGMEVTILQPPFAEECWEQLAEISRDWLHGRTAEKGFSLGRFHRRYLESAPIAAVLRGPQMMAFASLMPDYRNQREISVDLMRHRADAPSGCMDVLFVRLMEYSQRQGYEWFNLGMAPLAGVGESRYARHTERLMHLAYEYGNRFYNYKGLRSYKEKFQPQWRGSYLAYPYQMSPRFLLVDIAALIAGGYRRIITV